jgi:SAM-dependent methyltransferase
VTDCVRPERQSPPADRTAGGADERGESHPPFEAVLESLRADPSCAGFIEDNYFDVDTPAAAERFASSAEFEESFRRVSEAAWPAVVLDVGAGSGIATYAFLKRGARHVYALEPDPSLSVGRGAIARITQGMPCTVLDAEGESIPLADGTVDVVYARQVMHHARDLGLMARECSRVLRDGGLMLACREHVADDAAQKEQFLAHHPLHGLTGAENAYSLKEYLDALGLAGLTVREVLGPWDSVINLYPAARTPADVDRLAAETMVRRAWAVGALLQKIPGSVSVTRLLLRHRHAPGRLYSFLAAKVSG